MLNYNNRYFRPVVNTDNGEVSGDTLFHYHQKDNLVTAEYQGGDVKQGHLIATMDEQGRLDMRYHHLNVQGELQTGVCHSVPEILPDGRIRLHEKWQWTSGDRSEGASVVEEVQLL